MSIFIADKSLLMLNDYPPTLLLPLSDLSVIGDDGASASSLDGCISLVGDAESEAFRGLFES